MSFRENLAHLRASRNTGEEEQEQPVVSSPEQSSEAAVSTPEKRDTFSTRIRPSVRFALKRQLLESQERGRKIRMEDVLEALILKYVEEESFRNAINEEISKS